MRRLFSFLFCLLVPARRMGGRSWTCLWTRDARRIRKVSGASTPEVFGRPTILARKPRSGHWSGTALRHTSRSFDRTRPCRNLQLTPTRIQPGADFDATVKWRFQHRATKLAHGSSPRYSPRAAPGPQSGFRNLITTNAPGTMFGAVTGMASRSHYIWLGTTSPSSTKHPARSVRMYSTTAWCTATVLRNGATRDKWDWRVFAELVGEHSDRFVQRGSLLPQTQAHQAFPGPSLSGISQELHHQFRSARRQSTRALAPSIRSERVRFAVNFSYLLFQPFPLGEIAVQRFAIVCYSYDSQCPCVRKSVPSISPSSAWIERSVHTPCACPSCR
jgi:hypothetical protein